MLTWCCLHLSVGKKALKGPVLLYSFQHQSIQLSQRLNPPCDRFRRYSIMSIENNDISMIETRRSVVRRFYEPLMLLDALGRIRGKHIKPETNLDSASPDMSKLRRSFVDGIAYVCAYKKSSDFVTAAALEKTPQGIVLWLAANGGIEPEALHFTTKLVDALHHLAIIECKEERQSTAEQTLPVLLQRVVTFNACRLRTYISSITLRCMGPCLQILRSSRPQSSKYF